MTLLWDTLVDLWRLLDRREQRMAVGLVIMLFLSGVFEMGGILFLFGYIGALSGDDASNPAVVLYRTVAGDLDGRRFAAIAGLVLLVIFVLKNASGLLTSFMLRRFSMKRYERISTALFATYLGARFEIFQARGVSHALQTLRATTRVFRASFSMALAAISEIAIIATVIAALLLFLPLTFVVASGLLFGLGGLAFMVATRRVSDQLSDLEARQEREMAKVMQEGMRGIIDLRLAGREAAMAQRYGAVLSNLALADRRGESLRQLPRAVNELLLATGIVLAAVYFAGQLDGLAGAVSTLAVAGFAGLRLTAALSRLTAALQRIRQGSHERQILMEEIATVAPALLSGRSHVRPTGPAERKEALPFDRLLEARGLSFAYPDAEATALQNVSITIPKGAFIGLCGPSGGGKSTLALALMGLITPDRGKVLADGRDVREDLRAWYDQIGYVGQQGYIAPRNLRENVAFGLHPSEIDDTRVWQALEIAQIADMVRAMDAGLDTELGEDGTRLSGGQRQRISIARALYRDPELLVFDEATAALDNVTEAQVTGAIERISGTKTILAIAHRLSTLRACDTIHVVQEGCIVASGTFEELETHSPEFQRLLEGMAEKENQQTP
ncbi:ABC transporter ATP-binding protein [Aestuariicoccus sp. MJ-SS9]|uniref:ABC transporter ATP-binding protein n=1 Tax=Aestuariicoccus sp. MJ-SS9 TaxID=3079855 RepID=UPI00290904F7|nr:ABC transporter ATP-binding protein [Aestuariicoccus sp. MJ-SS9]MDU8913925.1 ABC transporter ATP-binding protein [Aestuariicoccus sp. MJ-SS9]